MANNTISQVTVNGTTYDLLDANTLSAVSALNTRVTALESSVASKASTSDSIKNITRSGTTFTATRANGTTFTFTQQDNNSTYPDAIKSITRSGTTFTATRYSGGKFTFTQQDNNTTYNMGVSSGNGTLHGSYISSGATLAWRKQNCNSYAIVQVTYDFNFKSKYSSNNTAVIGTNFPKALVGGTIVLANGNADTVLANINFGTDGKAMPWYCGNVWGHWYGQATYLASI